MELTDKHTLVIGGGIAGIASALELANNGLEVYLLEKEAAIGGWAAYYCCKATDVCTGCSVCLVPPKINEVVSHPRISILVDSIVMGTSGEIGNFRVDVLQKRQYISPERCIACGICTEVCPTEPKTIYLPFPETAPYPYVLDETRCLRLKGGKCNLCQDRCPTNAIDFAAKPKRRELSVGTIIVATGFEVFEAREIGSLGYGKYRNVLTGLDLEKMFNCKESATLPSSEKEPQKIAFIQCVGSRDERHLYCSQVCCKYAIRFARLIKYQNPSAEVSIFYIDLQTAGKGFAEFYEEYKGSIRFIRGVPVEIWEATSGELDVKFENILDGKVAREAFDLVVLSVGMVPRKDTWDLARILGINLGDDRFFDAKPFDFNETNVEGIFLAGACQGPKDIPDSIAHGMAAAKKAMEVLARCK